MRNFLFVSLVTAACISLSSTRASAQDVDAMAKWSAATVIHFHAVGEFDGEVQMVFGKATNRRAKVADRIEMDFDWDNAEMKIIGKPVFKNAPTKVVSIGSGPTIYSNCPAVKVNGTFENFTLESVTANAMMVELKGKRDSPPAELPYANESNKTRCGDLWESVAATSEELTIHLQVPQAMLLAMPMAAGEMAVSKDGKSIIEKVGTDGWVWTFTPTIVK